MFSKKPSRIKDDVDKSIRNTNAPNVNLHPDSFAYFADSNFMGGIPGHFTRKDLKHPLLKFTPESEKRNALMVWRIILRFMGDVPDYRSNMSSTYQPNLGAVMPRLYAKLGISQSERDKQRQKEITPERTTDGDSPHLDELVEKYDAAFGQKRGRGGTLGRLKATLTSRIFKDKETGTVFDALPLEESLQTPLEQLHFIIGYGILRPALRDEVYCQVCKQLSGNPFKTSIARGWLLVAMITSCFPPSEIILKYIINFLEEGPPFYSVNCKKTLQRTLQNGCRFQPPSFAEMEACLQKKMLEVSVTLMDGTMHSLSVDAATTAKELCAHLAEVIGLREKFGFSIYISMGDKVASLGNGADHIFDSISQCEQIYRDQGGKEGPAPSRLFFRKELFCPWESSVSDSVVANLVFAQIVRGVMLAEYSCDQDSQLAILAAQQYYIEYGSDISEEGLAALLPAYIPQDKLHHEDDIHRWRRSIVKVHYKLFGPDAPVKSPERVKREIVHFAKSKWSMAFSRYYDVKRLEGPDWSDSDLSIAVNWTGVYVQENGETVYEIMYPDILSISDGETTDSGSSSSQIVMFLLVSGAAFKFSCPDADDMKHLIEFMLHGLKKRSTYLVAVQSYRGISDNEIHLQEGDLIVLNEPLSEKQRKLMKCVGANERTGQTGEISLEHVYLLPVLTKPSEAILRSFLQAKIRSS